MRGNFIILLEFGTEYAFMHRIGSMKNFIALGITAILCMSGCSGQNVSEPVDAGNGADITVTDTVDNTGGETENGSEQTDSLDGEPEAEETQTVPILRDAVRNEIGGFVGCAVTGGEVDDPKVWDIVTTHFEAVTLGSE